MQDTRTLPDGTQLKGRWVMAEATAPTPSHDPHTLQSSPGFPTTAQGRNVNDNDYSQKGALVRSMAANYDGRAIDNPVFVKDGVVISGNNRTMSGALAAENNTDAKYLQALQQRAQSLGFTNEQVASFEHPRVFFEVTDDVPMTTETFAKFNQRESKSKTPTERAIVASKRDNSRLVGLILSELDKYETLQEAYQNANTNAAIIRYMVDTGLINQNEVPELYEDGSFTAAGKDFLESLLVGSVIEEDQIKALNTEGMKPLRSKVVKSIIPLTENSKLREENRILADINKAISYLYAAKRAGMSLNELVRQNNMFETQIWDEPAVFVALKLQEKEKEFKNFVEQVNARLSSETPNMFTGELETKQDIYGEYEQQLSAEQQSTLEAARESNRIARGINTQTETVPGNGAGYVSSGQRTDGVLKEPQQEAERIISLMEQNAVQAPDIELSQENWVKQFGEHGKISTPLGVVKIGDNQYAKIKTLNRDDQWGMILPTLTDPDIIIEERSIAKDGQITERSSSYIYVKTFIKSGQKVKYFASVSVLKDGLEVIISNHYVERKALKNKLENDRILYLKKELISNSSDRHLAENQNGLPDLLPTQENSSVSDNKANELSSEKQTASSQDSSQTIYEKAQNSVLNKKISAQAAKTDTNPTEKQKQAGNYKMGHVKVFGLDISIENPAGSIRSGKDADGNTWQTRMNNHYGYIKGTKGKDKDHIDVFLGDNVATGKVYVVDQINPDGSFDEHKVMLGFNSIEQAKAAYLSNYEQGWQGLGNITEVPVDQFKSWIANNSRKIKPFSEYKTEAIEQVKQAVEQYSKKYGVPVEVVESSQQVQNPTARAAIRRVEQTGRGKVFGWFEPKTGKVQIYAPSVAFSLNELEKTILHEVVAHKGLRSLLGEEKFNELCDEVFANMDDYIKLSFGAYVLGKPENELTQADRVAILNNKPLQREIADELMASFAERGVNEHPSLWEKVKQLVKKALKSIGVNINMTDADIAYLLYRSSKALQENTILEKANNRQQTQQVKTNLSDKNIARQMGFDTGLSSGDLQENVAETRLRYVERVNDKFNEDLQSQIDGTLPAGYVYQLGTPSDILLSSGLPYLPIELAASRLADKSMQQNHPFDLSELTGLVDAIQNPLAVFRSATHLESYVVLTEIQHKGKNYVVAIQTNKNKGRIRINDIRSVYPKNNNQIVSWINEGLLEYADKRRMPEWISKQRSNSAEVRNLFRHAAKVVNDFENPNISQENDVKFRQFYGGNSGYVGYSMSKRAAQAREEGRFPKTDFKKEYNMPERTLSALVNAGIIDNSEWHHTSMYGNKTTFYGWMNDELQTIYEANKKAVDNLCKGKGLDGKMFITPIGKNPYEYVNYNVPADYYSTVKELRDLPVEQREKILNEKFPEIAKGSENNKKWSDEQSRISSMEYRNDEAIRNAVKGFFNEKRKQLNQKEQQVRFRTVKQINDKFNEDLQSQIDGTLPAGYVYQLGTPSDILLSSGLPYLPIELAASRLADKSMQQNHPFDLSELTGLVDAIQNPLAVFRSATHLESYVVLTEIQHKGKNYVVAIQTNKNKGRIRINSIRSIHYRTSNNHIANWINEGLLEYVDKRRMPEWISKQQYNSADVRNLFRHAAKVVNDFENPNIPQGNDEITRFRRVYHGTKADFDKFDHSHMGEGEGAQAYGWGSYVTEVNGIGLTYAKEVTDNNIFKSRSGNFYLKELRNKMSEGKNFEDAKQELLDYHRYLYEKTGENRSLYSAFIDDYEKLMTFREGDLPKRHLYEVEIPDDNGTNYLDWENVISDEVIDNLQKALGVTIKHGLKGYELYDVLRRVLGSIRSASEFLSDVGFTGISYPAEDRAGELADGARNYVIFKEKDLDIVEHTRFRYTTSSGKNVNFTQLSLFDNKQEDEQLLLGRKLRPLQDGEFSHVERVFTETGAFSFMGSETVESADDVAYIFSQLEDESIENGFAVLVKDKKPYVLHVGMGAFSQTYFNIPAIVAADNLIKADAVYMVHNHPSGNLMASIADMRVLADLRNALGSKVQDGIIINLKTGKYGVFNTEDSKPYGTKADIANEYPIKVYSFNKQVFEHDFAPDKLFSIRSAEDVAGFVSSHRLGDRGKIGMLILNSGNEVVGNIFTQYASMDNLNADDVKNFAKEVVDYTLKMGGVASIIYGSGVNLDSVNGQSNVRAVSSAVNRLSAKGLSVTDWVSVEGNAQKYTSAIDEGIRFRHDYTPEMQQIKERTIADGTFMKAPNGNPTNLNERQWLQTRTQSFKNWFGDWEKPARIQKLKESEPVIAKWKDYAHLYELNKNKAEDFILNSLRDSYLNKDTNSYINVSRKSAKVVHHDVENEIHLKSVALIPQMIENAIFIEEQKNNKNNKFDSYRYYVVGINLDGEDYIAKLVIGVKGTDTYYDHALTRIEKNNLINQMDLVNAQVYDDKATSSAVKDKRLLSILQTNYSKVVDENGEPKVVYHGTSDTFFEFDPYKVGSSTGTADGRGFYFTTDKSYAEVFKNGANGNIIEAFLNIREPLSYSKKTITKRQLKQILREVDNVQFAAEGEHYLLSNYDNYTVVGIEKTIQTAANVEYEYADNDVDLVSSLIGASGSMPLIMNAVKKVTGKGSMIAPKNNGTTHYIVTAPSDIKSATDNIGDFSSENNDIRFRHDYTPEMQQIKERTIADDTFMKAPNGNPTNLNERQWLQTRTQSFKNWFGDWEKPARIQKLKESEPVKITGTEVVSSDDMAQYRKNAEAYARELRGQYVNKDTGEVIELTSSRKNGGIREILHHDYNNIEHLQSVAAIPGIIENSIYITSLPNEDSKIDADYIDYFVCGLKIADKDYTVKSVIIKLKDGSRYYDHKLTNIEKGSLLEVINNKPDNTSNPISSESSELPGLLSAVKDKRLLSILQTNSSKVVDENGEPRVVYHGSNYRPLLSKGKFIASDGAYGKGIYFTSAFPEAADYAREKLDNQDLSEDEIYDNGYITEAFLNITDKEKIFPSSYGSGENIYLVDNSSQIKSATDNTGKFSSENDDIRFKRDNSLVGLHNISEEKGLEGVLGKQGYDNLLKDLLIHLRVISLPYIFFWAVIFLMAHFLFL